MVDDSSHDVQEYDSPEIYSAKGANGDDGKGLNSQGYYVEVYENEVIFYGADLTGEAIYPEYCYIMEGSRESESIAASGDRSVIQPTYENFTLEKDLIDTAAELPVALGVAKSQLSIYSAYASFDQYQSVKRWYYAYKNGALSDGESAAVLRLKRACETLAAFALQLGDGETYVVRDAYYFQNNLNWQSVYFYAWNSDQDKNAEWPGVKLTAGNLLFLLMETV